MPRSLSVGSPLALRRSVPRSDTLKPWCYCCVTVVLLGCYYVRTDLRAARRRSPPLPVADSASSCGHRENISALPASDWSIMRIYPRLLRLIGPL
eukprot:5708880-Pyramimonas_sp.AAC.1